MRGRLCKMSFLTLTFMVGISIDQILDIDNFQYSTILCSTLIILYIIIIRSRFISRAHSLYLLYILVTICGFTHSYQMEMVESIDIESNISNLILDIVKDILPNQKESSVITAITLGDKSALTPELKESYANSGAMHILALSGLHVGIIYSIINYLLFFLNYNFVTKRIKILIISISIILYAYITGFSPSVQRATIMIILYMLFKIVGRRSNKIEVLSFSAFIICLIHPSSITNIGFQLSFSAILGIFLLMPIIKNSLDPLYNKITNRYLLKPIKYFINIIAITIACQIATLPFTFYYFGNFSPFFLITNIIAIPVATVILYCFTLTILFSPIPILFNLFKDVLGSIISLLNRVIEYLNWLH